MAGNCDDSFGDFTFASYPINALNPTPTTIAAANNEEDDEWGDFMDYSRGSDPSNGTSQQFGVFSNHGSQHPDQSARSSEPESSKIVQWVKPRGALPLSLFGEAEDEEKPDKEEKYAHVEAQNAKEEAKKLSNGSNTDSSIISNGFFANFYNQNPQFQSGKTSSNAGESGNLSSNLDLKKDLATTQSFDWNVTRSESKSQAVESSSMGWSPDLNNLLSNQTGITSDKSVAITSLSDHTERIESVTALGSKTDGLSSDITGSPRDEGTNNKAGSTAQEIQETKAYMAGFGNGSDRLIDFSPMSNGSVETDSQAHYTGDMKVYSIGIHNGSNGSLQSELNGHGTSNSLAYSYGLGNVSNHSVDLFSMSNGTDLEAHGGMNAFSSYSDGSAMSNESVKAETEAHDTGDLKANLSGYSESANGSIDLFTLSNGSIDLFATANGTSDITHENEVESNSNPSTCAQNGVETNEDFGEFTAALSDSGSKQVGELKETDLFHELEAAKSGPNCKGALPLSIFGDEELEPDDFSTIEDCFMHNPTSFPKSDNKTKPVISINDVISSLYSQGDHTSSISSSQNPSGVVEPPDSDASSNLVKNEDAFGDKSWDYKSSITQRRADEETSVFGHGDPLPSCSSTRKLDNYVDFYSELKKELCLYSKYHFGDLKRDQSIMTGEDAKGIALYEEIKGACKELDHGSSLCEGDDLEGQPSWKTCFHEFIAVLKEPKFQVLESEYNLSRRLSQMENDLNSAIELISHASIMLKLLTFASAEEQLIYVSIWYKIISVCNQELQHGTWLWKQILDKDAQSHVFSSSRGRKYILGLGEIYKVAVVLGASVKLYRPWTWLNHADFNGICSLLDECLALWSMSGLGQAISSISDLESTSTVGSCLDNIKSICDLDAFSLQNHISSQKEICRLSLLTSEVIHGLGMKLVIWNGEHYFLTLANLWANLVSHDPPELPHLSYGW
nr:homeobox protein 2-like isoform X1 [Ipomoea batatas]